MYSLFSSSEIDEFQSLVKSQYTFTRLKMLNGTYLMLFSAWFDSRLPNEITIIGVSNDLRAVINQTLTCEFFELVITNSTDEATVSQSSSKFNWTTNFTTQAVRAGAIIPDHVGSIHVFCPAPPALAKGHWYVSVSWHRSRTKRIQIEKVEIQPDRKLFAICVQPFHRKIDEFYKLIEMIELNRLLGVDAFYFYDHEAGPGTRKALQYYTNQTDFVEVIPWKFNASKMGVFIAGQIAALADCKHRVASKYKYVSSVDIDEFIIPRADKTWHSFDAMFSATNAFQLIFANHFYVPSPNDTVALRDPSDNYLKVLKSKLNSLTSTKRWDRPLPFPDRTKAIARSDCVEKYTIHGASALSIPECRGLQTVLIADTIRVGHLHHYRDDLREIIEHYHNNFTLVTDSHLPNTYEPELLKAVAEVLKHIPESASS